MGCRKSKPKKDQNNDNNLTLDAIGDNQGNGIPKVDKRLPLDARQVFKLKQSWKGIKRNIEETGLEMFIRLFKSNSYLIKIFKDFKEIATEDEMRANEALEKHASFVMATLDETISNIDNYEFVKDLSHRTGCSHQRFSDFQKENFRKVRIPFLEAVKITLGDRYTPYMENVYTLTIDFILESLEEGYTEDITLYTKLDNGVQEKEGNFHHVTAPTSVQESES